jgi:hypothetical protein
MSDFVQEILKLRSAGGHGISSISVQPEYLPDHLENKDWTTRNTTRYKVCTVLQPCHTTGYPMTLCEVFDSFQKSMVAVHGIESAPQSKA